MRERLAGQIRAAGGQVERLEEITPLLEDVFIMLAQGSQPAEESEGQP